MFMKAYRASIIFLAGIGVSMVLASIHDAYKYWKAARAEVREIPVDRVAEHFTGTEGAWVGRTPGRSEVPSDDADIVVHGPGPMPA